MNAATVIIKTLWNMMFIVVGFFLIPDSVLKNKRHDVTLAWQLIAASLESSPCCLAIAPLRCAPFALGGVCVWTRITLSTYIYLFLYFFQWYSPRTRKKLALFRDEATPIGEKIETRALQ